MSSSLSPSPRSLQQTCSQLAAENFHLHHKLRNVESGLAVYDEIGRLDALLSAYSTCVLCIDRIHPSTSEIAIGTRLKALGAVRRTPKIDLFCRHDPIQVYLGTVAVLAEFSSIADAEFAQGILQDQMLSGQPIRVRFAREFPTAAIAVFGAVCALPEAVVRQYFNRFGPIEELIMKGPIAEGWIRIRFRDVPDAVNCLILIRHKMIAGSLIEAHFADQVLGDADVGEPDPLSQQMARFDEIRSKMFNVANHNLNDVLDRNKRLLRLIESHLNPADEVRLPLSHLECLRLYVKADPRCGSLSEWITEHKIDIQYAAGDDERSMKVILESASILDRDVQFYLNTFEFLQERADANEMVDNRDLNQVLPYSDLTAREISVRSAAYQALVHYMNRVDWMRPRARLLYWLLNLNPERKPPKLDHSYIACLLRFSLYNATRSQIEGLRDFAIGTGCTADEFLERCEQIPSAMVYMSVAAAGQRSTDPKLASSLVFDEVGRRWLDFKHRVQYASLPLYDQSVDWPGLNIMKRAEALNKILQASKKSGRRAFRLYVRLLCFIDDCITERQGDRESLADVICHQSFESKVLFGLCRLQTKISRSKGRSSSAALTKSKSQVLSRSTLEARSPNAKLERRASFSIPRPKTALVD